MPCVVAFDVCPAVCVLLQAAIDSMYTKIESDEHKKAHEKKPAAAAVPAPAGAAAGPALAAA